MSTYAPCGTLTSKDMQIFVPRYVPSLLRNKEHTMWPPWPHLHVILHFFSPAAILLWNAVKKHMTVSVHLTLTQHCRRERTVSTDLFKAASPIFQKLKPVAGAVLWQLTTPSQTQYFRSKHGHITASTSIRGKRSISEVNNHTSQPVANANKHGHLTA